MRIKSVALRNYRLHRELSVSFDPSCTLIGGPNESGKSTIVEAIHRALFLRAKGNTEYHRAMISSLHPGHPEVELTFEAKGSVYVLKKRFGTSGTSTLSSAKSGLVSGDAAETGLASLLGIEAGATGKAAVVQWGHLWTWQGQAGDDPSTHATQQRDGLLQRLQVMGGAAALQSELDARVAAHFAETVSLIYTQAGKPKAGSELERAENAVSIATEEVIQAADRVERLDSTATDLETAGRTLQTAITGLVDLEKERELTEKKAQELAALQQKEAEQSHAAKDAVDSLAALESANKQIIKVRADIAEFERRIEPLNETISRLETERDEAREKASRGEQAYRKSGEATRASRLRHEWARAWVYLFEKTEMQLKLAGKLEKVSRRQDELSELEEQLAKLPAVDRAKLRKMQKMEVACSNAQAALHAMATGLEVVSTNEPVTANGQSFQIGEKQILTEDTEITIGSAVRLRIQPGGGTSLADARSKEADAQTELRQYLDSAGLKSVQDTVEVLTLRDDISSKIKAAEAELKGLGAQSIDEELQIARNGLAAANANVERLAALAPHPNPPDDRTAANTLAKELESTLRETEDQENEAKASRETSSAALETAEATLAAKRSETQRQRDTLTGLKAQLDLLLKTHGEDHARANALIERLSAKTTTELLLKSTTDAIANLQPDLLQGDRTRITRAIEVRTSERNDARTQIAVAQTALRSDGREDPQAALAAARAKTRIANAHRDNVRRKAEALALLDELFRDEQRTLAGQFTQPLADRISGYLQCIFGAGASAQVQLANNEFTGLRLARPDFPGESFGFDALSGGTREQTAAAVRLAMAELLATDHDGCLPIFFDDAFAHSDPDRVNHLQRMLDLAAARGLQVIIFACNPGDYSALGAHQITLT